MEKTKVITVQLPIEECFERLPDLLQELGWQTIKDYPEKHLLWWRKGDDWILKRRHDLWIALYEYQANDTKMTIIIKDARTVRIGEDFLSQDLADVSAYIQANLVPIAL